MENNGSRHGSNARSQLTTSVWPLPSPGSVLKKGLLETANQPQAVRASLETLACWT
jgi:hypothetical protein